MMPEMNILDPSKTVATMITVDRPGGVNYVHRTIKSLAQTGFFDTYDKLHLVVGCPSTAYVRCYEEDPNIILHEMTDEEADTWNRLSLTAKCAYGHVRMIQAIEAIPDWKYAMLFEDDILFARGWLPFLERTAVQLKAFHKDNWMLALYQHRWVKREHEAGRKWFPITLLPDSPYYYGGLAEIYPRENLVGMVDHLNKRCINNPEFFPSDFAMGEYVYSKGGGVFSTAPSLVQHIGRVSTGQSGSFHQSDYFLDSVYGA